MKLNIKGINKENCPPNARYYVSFDKTGQIIVRDNKTNKSKYFCYANFVYGQIYHDDITDKYPGYVHYLAGLLYNLYRDGHTV